MKLLLISNEYPPIGGGGSIVVKYLARDLVCLGHEVVVLTSSFSGLANKETIDGYKVIRVPSIRLRRDYCSMWELLTFSLSALIYSIYYYFIFKPDITQAFFAVPAGGISFVLNILFKLPYVIFLGGSDVPNANPYRYKNMYPILSPIIKLIWSRADSVVAASNGLKKIAENADPKRKFVMIPNGVDTKYFKSGKKSKKIINILGIGRLMPRKGYQFVVEALEEVEGKVKSKFIFTIVGGGDYMKELKLLAKKNKVDNLVKFKGQIDYSEIRKLLSTSDIFVHPSLAEGMPLSLLEAISSGLPSITTKIAGNEDLVKNGVNGYLLKVGDVQGISNSLVKLIDDQKLRQKMGLESARISKNYDWKKISKAYDLIYKNIYAKRKK